VKFMDKAGNLSAVYSDNIMQVMGTISGAVFKDTDPYDTYTYLQPIAAVVIDIMKNTEIIATAATYSDGTFGSWILIAVHTPLWQRGSLMT